jgi:hypothetical protein
MSAVGSAKRGGRLPAARAAAERIRALSDGPLLVEQYVDGVEIAVEGRVFLIAPVVPPAAPVVLADELKDLGAAVARLLLAASGGGVELDDRTLRVRV